MNDRFSDSVLKSNNSRFNKETSPKWFSASKCDVGNSLFLKSQEFFEKLFDFFFVNFM